MIKYKLENSFAAYKSLAQAYLTKHDATFNDVINNNFDEFERDKNFGLVKKLQKSYSRVRICELSDTYLTLQYK